MARFYARFDSGSGGWVSGLDGDYFQRLRVDVSSASAALLRDGLITSRSVLSDAMYSTMDAVNYDGSKGILFPIDTVNTDYTTYLSWSNSYTASATDPAVAGLKSPADYQTRPTASITSTQTTLIGPNNPVDNAWVGWQLYADARNAVNTILSSTQNGAGTVFAVYNRQGNYPGRTVHGVWHDVTLQYFAWDDFTPGTPQNPDISSPWKSLTSQTWLFLNGANIPFTRSWAATEYPNDINAIPIFTASLYPMGNPGSPTEQTTVQLSAGVGTYQWAVPSTSIVSSVLATSEENWYDFSTRVKFRDATLLAETPSLASDGGESTTEPGAPSGNYDQVKFYRMYGPYTIQKRVDVSSPLNCSEYTGATQTVYFEKNTQPLSGDKASAQVNVAAFVGLSDFSGQWLVVGQSWVIDGWDDSITVSNNLTCT